MNNRDRISTAFALLHHAFSEASPEELSAMTIMVHGVYMSATRCAIKRLRHAIEHHDECDADECKKAAYHAGESIKSYKEKERELMAMPMYSTFGNVKECIELVNQLLSENDWGLKKLNADDGVTPSTPEESEFVPQSDATDAGNTDAD